MLINFGVVRGFRTDGASVGETWNDGDILWYNPFYPGGLTNVQPPSPTPEIVVCVVITASSGNNGLGTGTPYLHASARSTDRC